MSEHISKKLAQNINKNDLINFYYSHLPRDTMKEFNIPSHHILNTVLTILEIRKMSASEISKIQMSFMTDKEKQIRSEKISQKHLGSKRSEQSIENMRKAQSKINHDHLKIAGEKTRFHKGDTPWNKGKKGVQKWIEGQAERKHNTQRQNHTFNSSSTEEIFYEQLLKENKNKTIERQYRRDSRYPYSCDFYIVEDDLFIECNFHWTHGGKPYDPNDESCQEQLKEWKEKAKTSQFYRNAIETWTIRDVEKQKCAKENNLNYKTIY